MPAAAAVGAAARFACSFDEFTGFTEPGPATQVEPEGPEAPETGNVDTCYFCKEPGHWKIDCKKWRESEENPAVQLRAAVGGLVQVVPIGRGSEVYGPWTWGFLSSCSAEGTAVVLYGGRKRWVVDLKACALRRVVRDGRPVALL